MYSDQPSHVGLGVSGQRDEGFYLGLHMAVILVYMCSYFTYVLDSQ